MNTEMPDKSTMITERANLQKGIHGHDKECITFNDYHNTATRYTYLLSSTQTPLEKS